MSRLTKATLAFFVEQRAAGEPPETIVAAITATASTEPDVSMIKVASYLAINLCGLPLPKPIVREIFEKVFEHSQKNPSPLQTEIN